MHLLDKGKPIETLSWIELLPEKIRNRIFLYCDFTSLEKTRELQSDYVKHVTQSGNIKEAIKKGNIINIRWLRRRYYPWYVLYPWNTYLFLHTILHGNLGITRWLIINCFRWDKSTFVAIMEIVYSTFAICWIYYNLDANVDKIFKVLLPIWIALLRLILKQF